VAVTGGFETSIAGFEMSATSPGRLLFEASVLLLLGSLASPRLLLIGLFLVAATMDSTPRRVGDGFEYMAMARNLARLAPPSVSAEEATALTGDMAARGDSTWDGEVLPTLAGADGRHDFPHFWMYSLLAAPLVAVAEETGADLPRAFTLVNLLLMLGVCALLVRANAGLVAVLFAALMLWWIDKAHAEVFFAALVAGALLLRDTRPGTALVMLGVAAAQGPVLAALLALCAVEAIVRHGPQRRVVVAALAALGVAALHPLYYRWRLGVLSPLADTVIPHVPPFRALVTPLTDLNLGVVWFAPVLCVLTLAGLAVALRRRPLAALPMLLGAAALLVAASQVANVNHGGTPGMSRYGVWTLAILLPVAAQLEVPRRWRPAMIGATAATLLFAAFVLHPRVTDAGIEPAPTMLADLVWTHAPALDNPLPEVFVERVVHADGVPAVPPLGVPAGTKALVACEARGGLCYSNGQALVPAPWQPAMAVKNTLSTR
jgi:hypothetical protein